MAKIKRINLIFPHRLQEIKSTVYKVYETPDSVNGPDLEQNGDCMEMSNQAEPKPSLGMNFTYRQLYFHERLGVMARNSVSEIVPVAIGISFSKPVISKFSPSSLLFQNFGLE